MSSFKTAELKVLVFNKPQMVPNACDLFRFADHPKKLKGVRMGHVIDNWQRITIEIKESIIFP